MAQRLVEYRKGANTANIAVSTEIIHKQSNKKLGQKYERNMPPSIVGYV